MDHQPNEITVFAKTNFRNREVPFGIKTDDRRRHMYLIGKTGMGKTTMMENMVIQDIRNGHGVAFLDPHGDSVNRILNSVPNSRVNDVIYFNPADMDYPVAFNILEAVDSKYKHLVASGLMGVFTKIWANLWSARMEYILNNTILALLDSPGNTLLGITRMYVDKKYRKKIVDNVKDPMVRAFWVDEFANYNEKYRTEAIAPIQNKVGQFLSSSIIRNIVGQPKSTIDLREIMDQRKILIMDLSKGKVGEDNSALLGAMLVTKLQLAAMSRTDIPEQERKDFYLYVDEFQNFATDSFATILSEARKYRLDLIVGHQYMGQLVHDRNTKVRDAILGNVGTMVVFRIGAEDAEALVKEFEPVFAEVDMVNLPKYNILLKLMINGVASEPFSAVTVPPHPDYFTGNAEKVIKVSRERYSNPVHEVEEKISRWMGSEFHQESALLIGSENGEKEEVEENAQKDEAKAPKLEPAKITIQPPAVPNPPKTTVNTGHETLTATEKPETLLPEPSVYVPVEKPKEVEILPPPTPIMADDGRKPALHEPVQQAKHPSEGKKHENKHTAPAHSHHQHQQHSKSQSKHQSQAVKHQPKHGQQPQKKENPIWEMVAGIQSSKKLQEHQKVDEIVSNILKPAEKPQPAVTHAHTPQEDKPSKAPIPLPPIKSENEQENSGNKRTVIKPGEAHTF